MHTKGVVWCILYVPPVRCENVTCIIIVFPSAVVRRTHAPKRKICWLDPRYGKFLELMIFLARSLAFVYSLLESLVVVFLVLVQYHFFFFFPPITGFSADC